MYLGALSSLDNMLHQHGGGVGAVTTSVLMKHVVEAAERA